MSNPTPILDNKDTPGVADPASQAADATAPSTSTSTHLGGEETSDTRLPPVQSVGKKVQVVGELPRPPHVGTAAQESDEEADPQPDDPASSSSDDEAEEIPDSALLDDYPPDTIAIDLTHIRLLTKNLRGLNLARFPHTESLCLRQNEIDKISAKDVGSLPKLKDLDLYDNQLDKVGSHVFEGTPDLEVLDLSFNNLRHVPPVSYLSKLHTIYLVQNKIAHVRPTDLAPPLQHSLRSLELGGNRLRSLENLNHLENLEELWVGKNKITSLEGLSALKKLRVLSIQSNRITKLEGLEGLTNLEELYIAHNGLTKLEGLEHNTKLTTLDIAGNQIEVVENVNHLHAMQEFWANSNKIQDLNHLDQQLGPQHMPNLNTVYFELNPAQRKEGAAYRRKLILALPQITQIDATMVR